MFDAERLVRAVTRPYPGAFFYEGNKKRVVWTARVSEVPTDGSLLICFLEVLESELVELAQTAVRIRRRNQILLTCAACNALLAGRIYFLRVAAGNFSAKF